MAEIGKIEQAPHPACGHLLPEGEDKEQLVASHPKDQIYK